MVGGRRERERETHKGEMRVDQKASIDAAFKVGTILTAGMACCPKSVSCVVNLCITVSWSHEREREEKSGRVGG